MEQHIAGASLTYALTAKTQIQLAWQSFFTATAYDAPWFNFRSSDNAQRGSVSVRMQF
jgi:hypothetical protein